MNPCLLTRRQTLKKLLQVSGGLALGGLLPWKNTLGAAPPAIPAGAKFIVEGIGGPKDFEVRALTRKVFEAAGGIQRFVGRQDIVTIKPNISWARAPHLAATTNPDVLEAVVELCFDAGAKKVRIADHTIHDARRCFAVTGVGQVAQKTNAELVFPHSSLMRDMKLQGHRLDVWPVFVPLVETDKVINLPVAKVHVLSDLTLGMKNWIGAVGGRRSALHQDIHQTIVDLARFFNPTLTLIDATRIMVANGPSGGSPEDVSVFNRLVLSNDPVAADALAATYFGRQPQEIGFIRLAHQRQLGTYDFAQLNARKVTL